MRDFIRITATVALWSWAFAQTSGEYCDELDRCFISHTTFDGITFGVALPEVTKAPFPVILQITSPETFQWIGFAWGGRMTYNPLTLSWPNETSTAASIRAGFSYALPSAYKEATVRVLDGSYSNESHWVSTIACEGCSQWDLGANPGSLNPVGENDLAFAFSTYPVDHPANQDSTFSSHEATNVFMLNLSGAQFPKFDDWFGNGRDPKPPITPSPTSTPTDFPIPQGPVPIPSDCGETSAFPLEAAEGWSFVKLAGDLTTPRGITVDNEGSLLLVEVGRGLVVHIFGENGCIAGSKLVIDRPGLTHGVALDPSGTTLYVSSIDTAWKYTYDATSQTVSNEKVAVANMFPSSHSTRTLLIPPKTPDLLVVSLGSDGNLDMPAANKSVGRATVKVFNMAETPSGGYDYSSQGSFLGYGLRNEIGLTADKNNMIWGVENSADNFVRIIDGVETEIFQNNPSDEVNYLGDPSISNEDWYGYPTCFTIWGSEFPGVNPITGSQFLLEPNSTFTDATCEERSVAPRLSFQAHSAPIDAKFDRENANMYVSLHGSWNRDEPTGYKIVSIPFTTTEDSSVQPVAGKDSKEGYDDILWDTQEGCDSAKCFRPSGIHWDREFTRLFIASDNSRQGELYALFKTT